MSDEKTCSGCDHFRPIEKSDEGECHGGLPQVVPLPAQNVLGQVGLRAQGVWPIIPATESCGGWKPRASGVLLS